MEELKTETTPLFLNLNQSILIKWDEATRQIAQRRYYVLNGADVHHAEVYRAVYDLFLTIKNSWKKDFTKDKEAKAKFKAYEKVFTQTPTNFKCDKCLEVFDELDAWLYLKGVTKFDTKIKYNRHNVEEANTFRGH
jgi:hypothetical protein